MKVVAFIEPPPSDDPDCGSKDVPEEPQELTYVDIDTLEAAF